MDTAQAKSPRIRSADAGAPRSLRTGFILAAVACGTGALFLQPFGVAGIFPSSTTSSYAVAPSTAATPRLATGLTIMRPRPPAPVAAPAAAASPPPAPAASATKAPPAPAASNPEPAPAKPVVAAAPLIPPDPMVETSAPVEASAPPPARQALPLQTSVVGSPAPRIGVAARPAVSPAQVSGSSTRPGLSNPNG